MAWVRDVLALVLGILFGAVWAVHMLVLICRGPAPAESDWLILPAGAAALLTAIYITSRPYQPRHRRE